MAAKIIDGEALAVRINEQVSADAAQLAKDGKTPHLVAIQEF